MFPIPPPVTHTLPPLRQVWLSTACMYINMGCTLGHYQRHTYSHTLRRTLTSKRFSFPKPQVYMCTRYRGCEGDIV